MPEVTCYGCGATVNRAQKYVNRAARTGQQRFFCSKMCCGKNPELRRKTLDGGKATPMHYYMAGIRSSAKYRGLCVEITVQDLYEVWERQDGRCAWTGIALEMHTPAMPVNFFSRASVDRLDSSTGYTKANIQFVCSPLNLAKKNFPEEDFRAFLHRVAKAILEDR